MAEGCRDCKRCTEIGLVTLTLLPVRVYTKLFTFWNIDLLQRKCPRCGHKMSEHKMVDGRFQD